MSGRRKLVFAVFAVVAILCFTVYQYQPVAREQAVPGYPNGVFQEYVTTRNPITTEQPTTHNEPRQSVADFFEYLHWTNADACKIPVVFGGVIYRTKHFVSLDGQKSVCLDPGVAPDPESCLVYSVGINNEWSFDDKMAEYGCQVFSFDPSMKQGDHQRSSKIQFFKTGLGAKDQDKGMNGWKTRTFATLKRELGHENRVIDILKIDIEMAEWAVLTQMIQQGDLKQVKQLAVEIHLFSLNSYEQQYWKVLKDIELSGFTRFSSNVNPFMTGIVQETNKSDFFGYEIAWFNQKFKRS